MPLLEQTQSAISELAGDRQREFGSHLGHMPKKNMPGINLGEIPFDPSKHSLSDISLFSLSEQATGIPHVQNVLPRRALNIQIVEDRSPSNDDSRIVKVKHNLANYLQESISDSKPGMTDRVRRFIITDAETEDPDLLGYDVELIDANEGPEAFTQTVAELCRDSLTLVISDFKRLRLDLVTNEEFDKVVGIKANHTAEMEMPAGSAVVVAGKSGRVKTNNTRDLAHFNASLDAQNQAIVERLEKVGIAVAQVVFKPKTEYGFDVLEADDSISQAIEYLNSK